MHSITDVENIDQKMLAEQIAEAHRLRPILWVIVFLAPLILILGLLLGIILGGW
jgi:hypothetical protein